MLAWIALASLCSTDVTTGPAPEWVVPIAFTVPERLPEDQIRNGVYELLVDTQEFPAPEGVVRSWFHAARLVHTEEGMRTVAQLQVDFDPSYQELTFHYVRVHRDGRVEDRLEPAELHTIQRESRLELQILDGTRTAVYFVPDVRVGDVLEYAFSTEGVHPTFAQRFTSSFGLQFDDPVERIHHRLVWSDGGRELAFRGHKTDLAPRVKRNRTHDEARDGAATEYVWDLGPVAPLALESYLPVWYDPYPWVQISNHGSWSDVARVAAELFEVEVGDEVRKLARSLWLAETTNLDRVRAALRFAQDEVRYLGLELGEGSWRPNAPADVLARRFGDCKDKSVLVASLLGAMGFEAAPALVHTYHGRSLTDWLPTTSAFDHVVVRAEVDGRVLWLDPTSSNEEGPVEDLDLGLYGHALVLDEATTGLVPVTANGEARARTDIVHRFQVHPTEDRAEFTVETRYHGSDATSIRGYIASSSRESFEQQCRDYYARQYPTIEVVQALVVEDGAGANELRTVERYRIPAFWSGCPDETFLHADFYPLELEGFLSAPPETSRSMPLGISYPTYFTHRTIVDLPEQWQVAPLEQSVSDPAFRFRRDVAYESGRLELSYELEMLADHVAAADVPRYSENIDRAYDILSYQLTGAPDAVAAALHPAGAPTATGSTGPRGEDLNWTLLSLAAMTALLATVGAALVWRWRPRAPVTDSLEPGPITGWLALLGLGVILSPALVVVRSWEFLPLFRSSVWNTLTNPGGDQYVAYLGPILTFEIVANVVFLVASLLLAALFIGKRRAFVPTYLAFATGAILFQGADAYFVNQVLGMQVTEGGGGARSVFFSVVWAVYVLRSERVKETFVRGAHHPPRVLEQRALEEPEPFQRVA